jgi:enoyl-CoA hydratase
MTMATAPAYKTILIERDGPSLLITINRPKVLNALSETVLAEIDRAIDEAARDDAIRVVIITGAGEKAFAAGADIGELQALESGLEGYRKSWRAHQLLLKLNDLPKPVIMAVNGYALGGGCELALAGDIIIASANAQFGQPEVNLGIIPGFGGSQRLPRLIGRTRAMELILTADFITAEEAERIGLINHVVSPEELLPRAKTIAQKIASKGPVAVALAKRAINEGLEIDLRSALHLEAIYFGMAIGTEDRREGTTAFLEKRPPKFVGR